MVRMRKLTRKLNSTLRIVPPSSVQLRMYVPVIRPGEFLVSCHQRAGDRRKRAGAWSVLHVKSGGVSMLWSYAECCQLIAGMRSGSGQHGALLIGRWIVMERTSQSKRRYFATDSVHDGTRQYRTSVAGQVLFDCVTGKWWLRDWDNPVTAQQLEVMELLMPAQQLTTDTNAATIEPCRIKPGRIESEEQ